MPVININQVTYPKANTQTQVCVNSYKIDNVNIELEDGGTVYDTTNINFDLSLNYIDYAIPGNIFELGTTSLEFTNTNIPYAFSDVVSLCKLQTNILGQLFYTPTAWNAATVYNINTIVSYTTDATDTTDSVTYTYMSLIDNTASGDVGKTPNLFTNYWQLQEYSSVGMVSINAPTEDLYPYPVGYQVYYNQNYYNANSTTPSATPSIRGIYTCATPTWSSTVTYNTGALVYYTNILYISTIDTNLNNIPGTGSTTAWETTVDNPQPPILRDTETYALSFNPKYWTLQTWDSSITYMQNYMVYYPATGTQTLYISLVDNNAGQTPSTATSSWLATTL